MKAKPPSAQSMTEITTQGPVEEAPAEPASTSSEAPAPSEELASTEMTTAAPQAAAAAVPAAASVAPKAFPKVVQDVGRILQDVSSIVGASGPSIGGAGGSKLPRVIGDVKKIVEDVSTFGAASVQAISGASPASSRTLFPTTTAAPGESKAAGGILSGIFGGAKKVQPPSAKSMTGMMPQAPHAAGAFAAAMPKAMRNIFGGFTTPPPPSTTQVGEATVEAPTLKPKTVYVPVPMIPARNQFRWPYHTVSQDAAP